VFLHISLRISTFRTHKHSSKLRSSPPPLAPIQVGHLTDFDVITKMLSLTDFATAKTPAIGAVVLRSTHDCALLLPCIRVEEILSVYRGRTKCTIYFNFGVAICNTRNPVRSQIKFDLNCRAYSTAFKSSCSDLLWDSLGHDLDGQGQVRKIVLGDAAKMNALSSESADVLRILDEQRQASADQRIARIKAAAEKRAAKKPKRAATDASSKADEDEVVVEDEDEVDAAEEEYDEYELEQIRLARETDAAIAEDNARNRINGYE
jgi:hypothetical protein